MTDSANLQTIEELKQRFDDLEKQKVRLQSFRERAQQDLDKLQRQAREQFGTDDLEALQTRLAEMKASNEKELTAYQNKLDAIEQQLLQIDASSEEAGRE